MAKFQLNAASGGINRQRVKGGPKPDNLYDILNGHVDASGAVLSRPGTRHVHSLPAGTVGICAFGGKLYVFSDRPRAVPDGVACEVLRHPNTASLQLRHIHFAAPMMGALYVVAEWSNGEVYHYWSRGAQAWKPNAVYSAGQTASAVVANGFTYEPHRVAAPGPIWQAGVERKVGDTVEPSVFNGYEYVVVEAIGTPARSGTAEPAWPTSPGAAVIEEADVAPTTSGEQAQPPPVIPPGYDNPGGSRPPTSPGSGRDDGPPREYLQELR